MLSKRTLELFDQLLRNVTLSVSAPDFEDATEIVLAAKKELAEALAESA